MKAWQHARASAHELGTDWQADLPVHEFLDQTKACYAHITHRFLLHNTDLASELLSIVFPKAPTAEILRIHLRDDLKTYPTLSEWLAVLRPSLIRSNRRGGKLQGKSPEEQAAVIGNSLTLADATLVQQVAALLDAPRRLAPAADPEITRFVMRHSLAPFIAERCLGLGHDLPTQAGGSRFVGVRDIAEMLIIGEIGGIPSYADVARAVDVRPWMFR